MISQVLLASFTVPIHISNSGLMFGWLVPLVLTVTIVYKATKRPVLPLVKFAKDVIVLSGTIVIFMFLIAVGLYAIMRLVMG